MDILFTIMFCPQTESHEHVLPYLENGFQNRQSIFHHQPQYVYTLLTSKFTHYFIQCSIFRNDGCLHSWPSRIYSFDI